VPYANPALSKRPSSCDDLALGKAAFAFICAREIHE